MSRALRLSEKWFRLGLWIVALVFAGFLIGLGSVLVGDLPQVEHTLEVEDYMDQQAAAPLRAVLEQAQNDLQQAEKEQEQAQLQYEKAQSDSHTARLNFAAWKAARTATQRPDQDTELIARTKELERVQAQERVRLDAVQQQEQKSLDARHKVDETEAQLSVLRAAAQEVYTVEQRRLELRIFLYRLALTLPLLLLAGWLFARKRRSTWWPFVWGFILFALFTFFVELVPYLPSYGGYVRYTVGIVITALVGRYAILALNRYLERQSQIEAMPDVQRRNELSYDLVLDRLGKGVCPGCERSVDLTNETIDFCPHCGMGLYTYCSSCNTRKNAFAPFCYACGTPAVRKPPELPELPVGSDSH